MMKILNGLSLCCLILVGSCGAQKSASSLLVTEASVYNGKEDSGNIYSPVVALLNKNGHSYCSGTFVSKNLIITAAHCLYDRKFFIFGISWPEIDTPAGLMTGVGKNQSSHLPMDYKVERVYISDDYQSCLNSLPPDERYNDNGSYTSKLCEFYDYAFIKVTNENVNQKYYEIFSTVGVRRQSIYDQQAVVVGYGLKGDGSPTGSKNFAEVEISDLYKNKYYVNVKNGAGICAGDSGGALLFKNKGSNTYKLAGVAAYTFSDGPADICGDAAVYINVEAAMAWIKKKIAL